MHPLLLALGAAAGGITLFKVWENHSQNKAQEEVNRQKVLGMAASELEAGKTYSLQIMVTNAIGTKDVPTASNVIASSLQQLGWKLLGSPVLRSDADKNAFAQGQPSQWVLTGVWRRRDKKYMDVVPAWLGMALPFKQPVADDPSAIL